MLEAHACWSSMPTARPAQGMRWRLLWWGHSWGTRKGLTSCSGYPLLAFLLATQKFPSKLMSRSWKSNIMQLPGRTLADADPVSCTRFDFLWLLQQWVSKSRAPDPGKTSSMSQGSVSTFPAVRWLPFCKLSFLSCWDKKKRDKLSKRYSSAAVRTVHFQRFSHPSQGGSSPLWLLMFQPRQNKKDTQWMAPLPGRHGLLSSLSELWLFGFAD